MRLQTVEGRRRYALDGVLVMGNVQGACPREIRAVENVVVDKELNSLVGDGAVVAFGRLDASRARRDVGVIEQVCGQFVVQVEVNLQLVVKQRQVQS